MMPDKVLGIAGDLLTLAGSGLLAYDAFGKPGQVRQDQIAKRTANYFRERGATVIDNATGKPLTPESQETANAAHTRTYAAWGAFLAITGFAGQLASRLLGP